MPPEEAGQVRIDRVRSHSCVNNFKVCGVERIIGKGFAQSQSDRVYDHYGHVTPDQIAAGLAGNRAVQDLWKALYDVYEMQDLL